MNIPDIYPSVPPQVFFQDKILHPLVEYESGKLDLGVRVYKPNFNFTLLFRKSLKIGSQGKI